MRALRDEVMLITLLGVRLLTSTPTGTWRSFRQLEEKSPFESCSA